MGPVRRRWTMMKVEAVGEGSVHVDVRDTARKDYDTTAGAPAATSHAGP